MTRHPRPTAAVVLGLAAAVIGLYGCGTKAPRQAQPPVAVDVASASRQDIATYIQLDGQITPLQQSNLSLPQSGTLTAVNVVEGQRVGRGELLAKIDDSTLRAQLAQAEANLGGASLTSPITRQQLQSAVISAQQGVSNAKNNMVAAQAAYDNAKIVFNGNQQLYSQGYLAQTALEQSRSQFVAAEQTQNNDRELLASAQAQLKAAQTNLQSIAVQKTTVAASQAAVQQLRTAIAQTSLYAPYGGVITQRFLDPGAFAGPNQNILQISQIDTVYVNANVPDDALSFVRKGTPLTFTSSSLPSKTFSGTVSEVNATPTQGTLSYRARIVEPNPGDALRGGMLVTVQVRKEYHPDAIVVPRTAIFQSEKGSSVFTVADGKPGPDGKPSKVAKQLNVTVGLQTDVLSEVQNSGLSPGALVITTRPDALVDGGAVAISQPPTPAGKPKQHATVRQTALNDAGLSSH